MSVFYTHTFLLVSPLDNDLNLYLVPPVFGSLTPVGDPRPFPFLSKKGSWRSCVWKYNRTNLGTVCRLDVLTFYYLKTTKFGDSSPLKPSIKWLSYDYFNGKDKLNISDQDSREPWLKINV